MVKMSEMSERSEMVTEAFVHYGFSCFLFFLFFSFLSSVVFTVVSSVVFSPRSDFDFDSDSDSGQDVNFLKNKKDKNKPSIGYIYVGKVVSTPIKSFLNILKAR